MTILPLHASLPDAWGFMPRVLMRIKAFCREHSPEENPEGLAALCTVAFVHPRPAWRMYAGVRGDVVVGHALASFSSWLGSSWVTVHQYQTDETFPPEQIRAHIRDMEEWGRSMGATELRAVVATDSRARAFSRFYGMQPWKTLLRREIGGA